MNTVCCRDCGEVYPENEKVCPKCGSSAKNIFISVSDSMAIDSEISGMKAKKPHLTGKKKIAWEWTDQKTVRGDNGKPVRRFKLIDRENNRYKEVVTDLTTGEVTHRCEEPLSEHQNHGSAKYKKEK